METRTFPASLNALEGLRDYVLAAAAQTELDKNKIYRLELAIDEIATNAILYGYQKKIFKGDADRFINITAELTKKSLTITLEDFGVAFNPKNKKLPNAEDLASPLKERTIGGLGIYLALTGVDRFEYQRHNGVNSNMFEVHLG